MPVVHQMVGSINPRCVICGRTPMQVQRTPEAPCRRRTLPFVEDIPPESSSPQMSAGAMRRVP